MPSPGPGCGQKLKTNMNSTLNAKDTHSPSSGLAGLDDQQQALAYPNDVIFLALAPMLVSAVACTTSSFLSL